MPPETQQTIVRVVLFVRFSEKFGRAPRMNEPVLFDPRRPRPMPLHGQAPMKYGMGRHTMVREREMAPVVGYAMKNTGLRKLRTPNTC